MPKLLSGLCALALCFALPAQSQPAFGAFAGGNFGSYKPYTKNFSEVYNDRYFPVGLNVGLGYNWFYIVGRFRSFSDQGQPKIQDPPSQLRAVANWKQKNSFIGTRFVKYGKFIDFFTEFGYAMATANESLDVEGFPGLTANFNQKATGFGVVFGLEKALFKYMAINGQVEWTRALVSGDAAGLSGNTPNLGGLFLGIGLNATYQP